jgi:hypothetical protein
MNTRKIQYIEQDEDHLEKEVDWAVSLRMEQRLIAYCKHITANYAAAGIDVQNFPVKRNIYYIENGE